jgi:hypothetical protein
MTTPGDINIEHPELEELAALIDGRLSAERAARVRAHLASCEECREVFFETVDFVREEEGRGSNLHPFERPRPAPTLRSRLKYALPAAALLAAGLGFALFEYQATPEFALARFASDLRSAQQEPAYHDVRNRGIDSSDHGQSAAQSFQLGVALDNFQVSLERENRDQAQASLAKINGLNDILEPAEKIKNFYRALNSKMPGSLRPYAGQANEMAQRFREEGSPADLHYLDFGMWAEAGKLASSVEDASFLTSRYNRRFATHLQRQLKEDGDSLPPEVQGPLQQIEQTLDRDPLRADDYRRLAEQYERIMEFYDRTAKQEPQ